MHTQKLCINTEIVYETDIEKRLTLIKNAGFEAFFTAYGDNLKEYRAAADKLGIEYPFKDMQTPTRESVQKAKEILQEKRKLT